MLDLLRGRVDLLLALLGSASQPQDEVQRGFFLDVVVGQGAAVFELFAGEDEALLVRRDAFFVWKWKVGVSMGFFFLSPFVLFFFQGKIMVKVFAMRML